MPGADKTSKTYGSIGGLSSQITWYLKTKNSHSQVQKLICDKSTNTVDK